MSALIVAAGFVIIGGLLGQQHMASAAADVARPVLTPSKPQRPISLRDRLVVGLQARTRTEVAFVESVVLHVHVGHLPQRLVDETFFWARNRVAVARNGNQRRAIIYFRPAMMARAKRLNVNL